MYHWNSSVEAVCVALKTLIAVCQANKITSVLERVGNFLITLDPINAITLSNTTNVSVFVTASHYQYGFITSNQLTANQILSNSSAYDIKVTYNFASDAPPPPPPTQINIGDSYGGGIVFYVDASGQHGLTCSAFDLAIAPWDLTPFDVNNPTGYNPVAVGGTNTSIGSGSQNTNNIVGALGGGNYAASIARNFSGGVNTDWYLPSRDELNLIYQNLKVPGLSSFPGSGSPNYYWSSSEISNLGAWCQNFDSGEEFNGAYKNNQMAIRAVRDF